MLNRNCNTATAVVEWSDLKNERHEREEKKLENQLWQSRRRRSVPSTKHTVSKCSMVQFPGVIEAAKMMSRVIQSVGVLASVAGKSGWTNTT